MVEQVLDFDKKTENTRTVGKHPGAASSNPQLKRLKEFCGSLRSNFKSDRIDRNRDRQPTVSTGHVRGPSRDIDIPNCEHCGKKHCDECWKLTPSCFRKHFVRDYPKNENATPITSQRSMPTFRGRGSNLGSSHSYVNTKLVESRSLKSEASSVSIVVSSPLGQSVLVDQVCRRFPLMIKNITFLVDLLIMPFGDFDMILGMDWLTKHGVIFYCCKKKFVVQSENGDKIEVNGIQTSGSTRIILAIRANKLLNQGCEAFLAYVINPNSVDSQCSKIQTVCEFLDVFPDKLSGLPPDREVEFAIEVFPSTAPVSMPPILCHL
ncbi:uncharacterized protein LOC108455618 [Gossypium arboreum]|uniref:uncharacterized protein LOC108455618 n=1 Tax=Gossypium arboreum TaxID=29729 RepID=UPI0008196965|nr:uncharacterized protein LOC108455618 [Gossypium arboreum]